MLKSHKCNKNSGLTEILSPFLFTFTLAFQQAFNKKEIGADNKILELK